MDASQVFSIANSVAFLMWVLMTFLPNWKVTTSLVKYKVVPFLLSVAYLFYIVIGLIGGGSFDFGSLSSVMELFTQEDAVLAGWLHYLAFDMFVGMWILDKGKELGIKHLLLVPCMLLTFMFGPVGFLLFTIIKSSKK